MVSDPLRRRSVGAPAARSLLLTILGEFMLPRREAVWQETLVNALGAAGISVHAARQALTRSTRDGWLTSERHGRRTRLILSKSTAALLSRGASRIYSFGPAESWDGEWLLVVLRVPEAQRELRHQLRVQLAWAGLGSLRGGIWITPHTQRESEIAAIIADEPGADVVSFCGRVGQLGEPRELAQTAWNLDSVASLYGEFIDAFSRAKPSDPEAIFGRQALLVHAWRKFPFLDPGLPPELLPARWPLDRAHKLFHQRHDEWREPSRQYFEDLEAAVA
jgi:phenylacetic acid degradation operon negative regulatory protein